MNISQFLTKLKTLVYSKNEIDTKLSAVVHTSGAEDISGNKNFIDNLTRSGKNVDAIEEQGDGYIRYSSGLQICWGWQFATTTTDSTINFPRAFIRDGFHQVSVSVSGQSSTIYALGWNEVYVYVANTNTGAITYTAVGWWK